MSFRAKFFDLVNRRFSIPATSVDAFLDADPDGILQDQESELVESLSDLELIMAEENDFLSRLVEVRTSIGASQLFSDDYIRNVDNLLIALRFADGLTADVWDSSLRPDRFGLGIFELLNFDVVDAPDMKRVRVKGFQPRVGDKHAIVFLDFRELTSVGSILESDGFDEVPRSSRVRASVAFAIAKYEADLLGKCWCVCARSTDEARRATLTFHLVLSGCILVRPKLLPPVSDLGEISDTVLLSKVYRQYAEPFEILGEFNSRTTVLDAFLSLYHVVENYMLRARIVGAANGLSGTSFFSIRDFKRLSLASEGAEYKHLDELIKQCWDQNLGGKVFSAYVLSCLNRLTSDPNYAASELNDFLVKLTVKQVGGPTPNFMNASEVRLLLSKLIYQIRCSIVHNKETEFHISNRVLDNDTVLMVLNLVVIPAMRRVAFGLPSLIVACPIKYENRSIDLYR